MKTANELREQAKSIRETCVSSSVIGTAAEMRAEELERMANKIDAQYENYVLKTYGNQEPDCPFCSGGNAMLNAKNSTPTNPILQCRDCGCTVDPRKAKHERYEWVNQARRWELV